MAFEGLNKFVDLQAAAYRKKEEMQYLYSLTDFYETVLQNPKFKSQKRYCLKVIHELNQAYFIGYFKRVTPNP